MPEKTAETTAEATAETMSGQVAHQEVQRLQALRSLRLLDTPPEERFDRAVRLAQQLFKVPMARVNLVDEDRLFAKASAGLDHEDVARDGSFCDRTVDTDATFVVADASHDPRFADLPYVRDDPHLRFYAGAPLRAPGGQPVGTLCLFDRESRAFTDSDRAVLRDLADWVEKELATGQDLDRAGEVQRALLPRRTPTLPGYEVAGRCIPARQVGGDFFDWHPVDDVLQVTVADVMGKGLGAALLGAGLRAVLRGASRFNALDDAVNRSAASIEGDLRETSSFVTLWTGRVDPQAHTLAYVDAGHGLTSIVSADGTLRRLVSEGLPLGALDQDQWGLHTERFAPGDTLVSVSDGLLDLYPDIRAAGEALREACTASSSADELVKRIVDVADSDETTDDVTVVVVRRTAE